MSGATGLSGILLIDKASGWTSHDVVARVRRISGQRRVGHTGTLDPMATGLLVVCLGQATRLIEYMVAHHKRYTGEITLGSTTDTDDAEGTVTERQAVPGNLPERIAAIGPRFVGTIEQLPPAYSALKLGGRKAYDIARAGQTPALTPRPVRIDRLDIEIVAADRLRIAVACGSGTYVRSLARDIGAALGCGGHLSALRRERAGPFTVSDAITLDELAVLTESGYLTEVLLPADEGVTGMDAALVSIEAAVRLRSGLRHRAQPLRQAGALRLYDESGEMVGIGGLTGQLEIQPAKIFPAG